MFWRGMALTAVCMALGACASTDKEGVACATSSLFVAEGGDAGNATQVTVNEGVADMRRLAPLVEQGCNADALLGSLDDGSDDKRLAIAEALYAARMPTLAVAWFERAESLPAYERLLAIHGPGGTLADDAAYLRYEVRRAQLQQAFGESVAWPSVAQAQPLYVRASRSALHQQPDLDAQVLEAFGFDERVYLIDVVLLEDGESYWVEAYYPPTLSLGWIPAEDLAQQPALVRDEFDRLDAFQGRSYAQQVLFTALLEGMDTAQLQPLGDRDFFDGASRQQQNSIALLQRLGAVADSCLTEVESLEQALAYYLMNEGPAPTSALAPNAEAMREALAALTQRPGPGVEVTDAQGMRQDLADDAYQYFRIRSLGQIEQRLCFSLPNAAGDADFSGPACEAVNSLQQCLNRVDAIFDLLDAG